MKDCAFSIPSPRDLMSGLKVRLRYFAAVQQNTKLPENSTATVVHSNSFAPFAGHRTAIPMMVACFTTSTTWTKYFLPLPSLLPIRL